MKKMFKKVTAIGVLSASLLLPAAAFAATDSFSYNFKHQLGLGVKNVKSGSINVNTNTTSWGSSSFQVQVYKKNSGSVDYVGAKTISKSGSKSATFYVSNGSYSVELWKDMDGKYIKGSGTVKY